jgi:hypothetical protein
MKNQSHDTTGNDDRFLAAKALMTEAAEASIANLPGAAALATAALAELERATAPAFAGEWAVARDIRLQLEQQHDEHDPKGKS